MKQRFTKRTRLVSALLTLAMVFTFLPFSAFAATDIYGPVYISNLTFPDETFQNYVKQFDENNNGTLSPEERYEVTEISVANKNISNLYGIQFFPNLEKLDCDQNNLSSLDVSQNPALKYLYCEQNNLSSLDVSSNSALKYLHCTKNNLSSLDVSQNPALEYLLCAQNKLTSLDVSKNEALKLLNCKNNQLTNLNVEYTNINPSVFLSELLAQDNTYPITVGSDRTFNLSALPGKFEVSKAYNWNGGSVNGNTLTVNKGETQVTYTYDCGKGLSETFTLNVTVGIRIDGDHFPNYEFRRYLKANIDKDGDGYLNDTELNITELDVSGQYIANLKGIEFFPHLEKLYCYNNKLTSLDVSKNTGLLTLSCYENKLTSLDVSQNTKLEELLCGKNQLTELDVRNNTALWCLSCYENKLTSLDVSHNTQLEQLDCGRNQLTELDVHNNTKLWYLSCYENNLTSLDVSQNPALQELYCGKNRLTSLDVSQTVVATLKASGNQIDINVETTPRTFDLSILPGFDVTKVGNWVGGTVSGNTLTVNEGATQVTYTYDCGKGLSETFTLNVKVVPDGTVTPPSGGGTTIPPEAGKYQLTVTDGVATLNDGSTGHVLNVKPGDTVTLTADTTKFPENEEFGWWEITPYGSVSNTLTGQYQRTATFTMPNENVSARAMSKSAGVSTGGDDGGGGGGAAILLVGGAAVAGLVGYGVYSYVSEQQLKALLPEGVAMPENRAQTALLLWNTAGRPEPAEAPAFKDVADPDTAKAAQWCVEHGLMDQKLGGRFAPDNSDPAYKTLNAYQQLVG